MKFTKMHGIGNDYIYVDVTEQIVAEPSSTACAVSDRNRGIGGDGLILIHPSEIADVRMQMFNADGSESEMCGNGIRCVAKYAWDHKLARSNPMRVETLAGVKQIDLQLDDHSLVVSARVNMSAPMLGPADIPAAFEATDEIIDQPLDVDGQTYNVTCVSMGNPHVVIFCDDVLAIPLEVLGPKFENHRIFPERINAHFVQVHSDHELTMRTWERGSGPTLACGTGASAVCVAGVLTKRCSRETLIHLPGGDLLIEWNKEDDNVYMTGPAEEVFHGEWFGQSA